MGKDIKLICTVIPNGRIGSTTTCRFSVFLSPRLPNSGRLSDYYEILYWPGFKTFFLGNSKLRLRLAKIDYSVGDDDYSTPAADYFCDLKPDTTFLDQIKVENPTVHNGDCIWKSLFAADTPVEQWVLDEGLYQDRIVHLNQTLPTERVFKGAPADPVPPINNDDAPGSDAAAAHSDISANLLYQDEIKKKNRLNQEFHKKISILSSYPHLLRMTGWILDFKAEIPLGQDFNIVKLDGFGILPDELTKEKKWARFSDAIDFKTPWTFTDKTSFVYAYADKYKDLYFEVQNGFINAAGKDYTLDASQFLRSDMVGAAYGQIKNLSNNSDQLNAGNYAGLSSFFKDQKDTSKDTSEGIQLRVLTTAATPVQNGMSNPPGSDQVTVIDADTITIDGTDDTALNIDNYILFGHHIDTGYIVEVSVQGKNKFSSLCERVADYAIEVSPDADTRYEYFLRGFEDHASISEVAVAGKSGKIYVKEDICRWNNWSLVCEQKGTHPEDPTANEKYFEFNNLELRNIKPKRGTLLPMRFGEPYDFRIKIVDLCGNYSTQPAPDSALIKMGSAYKRLENVEVPTTYLTELIFQEYLLSHKATPGLKPEWSGEQLDMVVIRSVTAGSSVKGANKVSARSVAPPRVTHSFAELHGPFDTYWGDREVQEKIFRRSAYHVPEGEHEIFPSGTTIPFITDPAVSAVKFKVVDIFTGNDTPAAGTHEFTLTFPIDGSNYLTKKMVSIRLEEGGNGFSADGADSVVFGLEKTGIAIISISSIVDPAYNAIFLNPPAPKTKLITLAHAVDRPYLYGSNSDKLLKVADRLPFTTGAANINVRFDTGNYKGAERFPFSSCSEVRLMIQYSKVILDKKTKKGYRTERATIVARNLNTDTAPENTLPTLKYPGNSLAGFLTSDKLDNPGFVHSFGDTLYHSAEYTFVGLSRFMHFFPESKEEYFSYKYSIGTQIIKNSEKLKAPKVFSIVPLLDWNYGAQSQERVNNTFRVYFDCDWFISGECEQLAVLYLNGQDTVPDELQNIVSSYGKDPSNRSEVTKGLNDAHFPGHANIVSDVNFRLFDADPKTAADKKPLDGADYNNNFHAALFKVQCDSVAERYYADITLAFRDEELDNRYMPFLKFAIARYQENSIGEENYYDFRFSTVICTPQLQQLPRRQLSYSSTRFSVKGPLRITPPIYDQAQKNIVSDGKSQYYVIYIDRENHVKVPLDLHIDAKDKMREKATLLKGNPDNMPFDFNSLPRHIREIYLEEYELYDVLDSAGLTIFGQVDESEQGYTPRNDLRKRMISSFKITIK